MQSDGQYMDKADDFSRKVGEKLREHQMPVDPDVWDLLAEKFPSYKKSVSVSRLWVATGAAVAVVVLAVLFLWNPMKNGAPLLTDNLQNTERTQSTEQLQSTEQTQSPKHKAQEKVAPDLVSEDLAYMPDEKPTPGQVIERESLSIEIAEQTASSEPTLSVEPSEDPKSAGEIGPVELIDVLESLELAASIESIETEEMERRDGKNHEFKSLIAALGSGSAPLDFSLGGYDNDYMQNDGHFPGGDYNDGGGVGSGGDYDLLKPGDYTDVVHRLPVSLSLTADFPIAKDLSLETGLSYTYLFSRYRRNDYFIYRGTLRQHYIGIPVNLRYTVWKNDAWNVYLLGGGSIEKGLRSIYKQEIEHNGGVVYHTKIGSSIDGFQFSTQAGAGFSYRLQGNLSLFGEPRIVYYFNNNQPMSARTENPLIFGLNIGVRLGFK